MCVFAMVGVEVVFNKRIFLFTISVMSALVLSIPLLAALTCNLNFNFKNIENKTK